MDDGAHQSDAHRVEVDGRHVVLVGTAHISQESVDIVRETIRAESPDVVCVELDERRYKVLSDPRWWEALDLFQVIKGGQAPLLVAQLALSSFQKRMGLATGVKPGSELAAAVEEAKELGVEYDLVDREIRTTLLRAWRKTSFWKKTTLAGSLVAGMFMGEEKELNEDEMRKLRQQDTLSNMLDEMGDTLPSIKTVLVDERDVYMSHRIRIAGKPGDTVVAVVGAAHVPGMLRQFAQPNPPDAHIAEINTVPGRTFVSRALPWILPAIVIGVFAYGFAVGDWDNLKEAALAWVLANGLLSALGAALALGHPLTIIAAFFAAPLTSLNPTIGAGFVTGLVQTWVRPPAVRDMEKISDDVGQLKGWWTNRLARVLLVFVLSNLGSSVGTFVAFGWLKDLIA
jgi:pheromone shutdown-related protein TraB